MKYFRAHFLTIQVLVTVFILLFQMQRAGAAILIITHPDPFHDVSLAGGECSRMLLESTAYSKKLVLMEAAPLCRYTFSSVGLDFSHVVSLGGEHDVATSGEVTLAGGYFDGCMEASIISLIELAHGDLVINLKMAGIYFVNWSLFPDSGRNLGRLASHRTYNLIDFEKTYGSKELNFIAVSYGKAIYAEVGDRIPIQIETFIDGKRQGRSIGPKDTSVRRVRLNFVH